MQTRITLSSWRLVKRMILNYLAGETPSGVVAIKGDRGDNLMSWVFKKVGMVGGE